MLGPVPDATAPRLPGMGRALAAVGGLLMLCFAILGGVIYLTRSEDRVAVDNLLAERLTRAVATAEERGEDVVLAELTPFRWERVLVAEPDTPAAEISKALGSEFKGDLNYSAESGELFVFVRDGELARFADYRGRGVFAGLDRPVAELRPGEAVFTVRDLVARPK